MATRRHKTFSLRMPLLCATLLPPRTKKHHVQAHALHGTALQRAANPSARRAGRMEDGDDDADAGADADAQEKPTKGYYV